MEQPHLNWKNIPFEILLEIFKLVIEGHPRANSSSIALICKAWERPAKSVLYSNVYINSLLKLNQFHNTISQNYQFGKTVKILHLRNFLMKMNEETQKTARKNVSNILTLLYSYLSNLEELEEGCLHSYSLVLNALSRSELKYLGRLHTPIYEVDVDNYVACIISMKSRLQNILISDNFFLEKGTVNMRSMFGHLYNTLHQFVNLTEINIECNNREEIRTLEHVVESCKLLKKITFDFEHSNNAPQNNGTTIASISNIICRPQIKTLTGSLSLSIDCKTLLYIMRAFPQLQELTLNARPIEPLNDLDQSLLTNLLYFLSRLPSFELNYLKLDYVIIAESFRSYWNEKARPEGEYVSFMYVKMSGGQSLTLLKQPEKPTTFYILIHSRPEWVYSKFLERNGKFLNTMSIAFGNDFSVSEKLMLIEHFMVYTLIHCLNLETLILKNCSLKRLSLLYSTLDFNNRFSLTILDLRKCTLYAGALEQFSLLFPEIIQLSLSEITFLTDDSRPSTLDNAPEQSYLEIALPCTKIVCVLFMGDYAKSCCYLKVLDSSSGTQYYYQYDPSKSKQISVSSKQEYTDNNDDRHIFICCQKKPILLFKLQ